jgi:hypothetical protein
MPVPDNPMPLPDKQTLPKKHDHRHHTSHTQDPLCPHPRRTPGVTNSKPRLGVLVAGCDPRPLVIAGESDAAAQPWETNPRSHRSPVQGGNATPEMQQAYLRSTLARYVASSSPGGFAPAVELIAQTEPKTKLALPFPVAVGSLQNSRVPSRVCVMYIRSNPPDSW